MVLLAEVLKRVDAEYAKTHGKSPSQVILAVAKETEEKLK